MRAYVLEGSNVTLREVAEKFVELSTWIRELSSPQIANSEDAASYREELLTNFRRIGDIAQIKTGLLNDYLMPVLDSDRLLTEEEVVVLRDLRENLMDAYVMDNMDAPTIYRVARRLCEDAERKHDEEAIVRSLDDFVMATYAYLTMVRRVYPYCDSAVKCREEGLQAVNRILEYLPPEKLKTLPEGPVREAVLINARYIMTLYEYPLTKEDSALSEPILQLLRRALSLKDVPEYRELVPDFDWIYHEFRTLHYCSLMTIFHNMIGFNQKQLAEINEKAKLLLEIWEREYEHLKDRNSTGTILFAATRCAYLAGDIDKEAYKARLIEFAANSKNDIYNVDEMQRKTTVPLEYMLTIDRDNISEKDQETLVGFYKELIRYVHGMPKLGNLPFLLTELAFLLDNFIDIDGAADFGTMCLELLAAIHPPTYIHSLSVADLSACLAKHLFRKHPDMFANTPGYPDVDAIMDHIWRAAACHDIGKLFVVETIITYGRPLYDREFDWIRCHPEVGARLLSKHEKTKDYADVALGHQRWYDGKGGYPETYDPEKVKNRLVVDLVACADCLDAATDNVGRTYKKGKTLDGFVSELKEGSGTRYAPFLLELFDDEEVYLELEAILNSGRDDKYRHTYTILEKVMR